MTNGNVVWDAENGWHDGPPSTTVLGEDGKIHTTVSDRRAESAPGRRSHDLAAFHDAHCSDASCVAHREAIRALETSKDDDGPNMTDAQRTALRSLCDRYSVDYVESHYAPQFDLPAGYVAGWIGGSPGTLYVGVDVDGNVSS